MNDLAKHILGHQWNKLPLRVPPDLRGHVEKHKESRHNRNPFVNRVRGRPDLFSIQRRLTPKFANVR